MDNDTVGTEELEALDRVRRTCGHDYLRSGCQDCDNLRAVNRSWSEFRDRVSYEELVRALLARREWETQARKALEAIKADKCYCDAHQQVFSADEDLLAPCPHEIAADALATAERSEP